MRQAARTKGVRSPVAQTVSLPAPTGGWNARDNIAQMDPKDAVVLRNWFPGTTECSLRKGFSEWATGLPDVVESLLNYEGGNSSKLFAVSDGECYDVTSSGEVGTAEWTAKANSRWQSCNIATAGGNYMMAANGADAVYHYNGSVWANPTITGVTATNLNNPIVFKNRVFFTENNTLKTWYLPTQSIAGAANAVDMSAVAQMGGYIVAHGSWTIDAGAGVDDYYVAVTSKGEVIVYKGTDPSSSSTWALQGVWRLGSPVGTRCLMKYGGDVLMISQDGLVPLSGALQSSRVNPRVALTDKIQRAISEAVSYYGSSFGWETVYFPKENQLWLNIPTNEGKVQCVMNTITKNWCEFSDIEASCFSLWNDDLYFGGDTAVYKAWDGNSDNGIGISGMGLQAFSAYGNPGLLKRFTAMRPVLNATSIPGIIGQINTDFDESESTSLLTYPATVSSAWGSSLWGDAKWGGGFTIYQSWQGASGVGYFGAPQIRAAAVNASVQWISTDVVFEPGAIL